MLNRPFIGASISLCSSHHYYAYGLKIAGISSVKLSDAGEGVIANKYLYNDKELYDDGGLNWYNYGFRSYDPQTGRFMQLDPLTDDYPELTPYQYASCDPVANTDMDGLEANSAIIACKTLTTVTVVAIRPAVTALSVTRSFFSGILSSAISTLKGIVHVVLHPVNTVAALTNVIIHPIRTYQAVQTIIKKTYKDFKNGDGNKKAQMIGHAAGDIAQLFIGVGEEKAAVEISEDVGEISEAVKGAEEAEDVGKVSEEVQEGGLNLYKYKSPEAETSEGWKDGDRFLNLPDQGSENLNWAQNESRLLEEMKTGKPIYDSYRKADGTLIKTKGFLQKERNLLKSKGWRYYKSKGAWLPK